MMKNKVIRMIYNQMNKNQSQNLKNQSNLTNRHITKSGRTIIQIKTSKIQNLQKESQFTK